jgi:hypothetical protein
MPYLGWQMAAGSFIVEFGHSEWWLTLVSGGGWLLNEVTKAAFDDPHEGSLSSARAIVPIVMRMVRPTSVIDLGCRTGDWLSVFREHGVERIKGLDAFEADERDLRVPRDCVSVADLREPYTTDAEFDLAVSLEVAEHLPEDCADTLIETLVGLAPVVLFSAAIPFQDGLHHVNSQWPEYWRDMFSRRGYVVVDCIRSRIWNDESVEYWYAQNTLLYVREDRLGDYSMLVEERERTRLDQLALVHPRNYTAKASADVNSMSLLDLAKTMPVVLIKKWKRR